MRAGWRPIADFEADPKTLTDGELESLSRVWADQKAELSEEGTLDEFDKRLRREWSIETGIIENVYTLDRGVTRNLIEKGIDAALIPHEGVRVARIIQDHYEVLDTLFDFVGGQRQLSTGYIKELHAALLRNQETHTVEDQFGNVFEKRLEKGLYKTLPNNPTRLDGTMYEYCPPEHVASEMDRLVAMHAEHEAGNVPVEVKAAWLHHRFTQIHPFADGNGRVARAIASLVLIKAGLFPLTIKRENRVGYIEALEKADDDDLKPLVTLVLDAQREALMQAAEVAYDVQPPSSVEGAIAAVRDRLQQRGRLPLKEWSAAKETANRLTGFAVERLREVARFLGNEIAGASSARGFSFNVTSFAHTYVLPDAILSEAFKQAGQMADFDEYSASIQLNLGAGQPDSLRFSFYAIGPRYRGLLGVLPYLFVDGTGPSIVESGIFQINYAESYEHAQARFSAWLERIIVAGLNQWRLTL